MGEKDMPNAELAYRVLDQIDAHPERWDQKRWWCGTSGCFAGWAVVLSDGEDAMMNGSYVRVGDRKVHTQIRAFELLGISDDSADQDIAPALSYYAELSETDDSPSLFHMWNSRADLQILVENIFGERP
jgi:hypothetical protein